MKLKKMLAAALLGAMAVLTVCPAGEAKATTVNSYTYNYDYWETEYESPDAYEPTMFITGKTLLDQDGNPFESDFRGAQGLFVRGNKIYVINSVKNNIVEITYEKETYTVTRVISEVVFGDVAEEGIVALTEEVADEATEETTEEVAEEATGETSGEVTTLKSPQDVFVDSNGDFYIADMGNNRILHLNSELKVQKVILRPTSSQISQENPFEPNKIVVDRAGRMFVLAKGVNKGVMQFEPDGEFKGFVGASEVVFSMADYIKKLFSTKAQRDQMVDFVPTEYNNLYIDNKAFMYCITDKFEEADLKGGTAKPIRKLNSLGKDILIRNGNHLPIGDVQWENAGGKGGPSRFADITAMEDETYYVIDYKRGHIFGYDEQGHLLYVFGGAGNSKMGYFLNPVSIEHMGTDLYVLDTQTGGITKFERTEFGNLIHSALDEYSEGHYETSAAYWEEVLDMNGNYELAYIGIGRALLRQEKYEEAMYYFEIMRDDENYSRAWKYYRKEWIESNLGYVVIILVVLGFIPTIVRKIKKIRWEARIQHEFESESKNK